MFTEVFSELRKRDNKALEKHEIRTCRTEEEKRPRLTTTSHFTTMTNTLTAKVELLEQSLFNLREEVKANNQLTNKL